MQLSLDERILVPEIGVQKHINAGFTTRKVGDARNKDVVSEFLNEEVPDVEMVVFPKQIHSSGIEIIKKDSSSQKTVPATDGVITKDYNVVLTIITADCVPILFADAENHVIGASHQGWKGSLNHMAERMVAKMVSAGANKDHIQVAIGPSIGSCCYDIPQDRVALFKKEFSQYSDTILEQRNGKTYLNLLALNMIQLLNAGIKQRNIEYTRRCTSDDIELFYSFRKDSKETFGEILSYISLTP